MSKVIQPEAAWQKVLDYLKGAVAPEPFATWLAPTRGVEFDNGTLTVEVPNPFFIDWLGEYYTQPINDAVRTVLGEIRVTFRNGNSQEQVILPQPRRHPVANPEQTRLQERYSFRNFIVAECNQFAYAAAKAVADAPGSKYNPLLIYGGVGLGKTHLMQAIGNHLVATKPGFRVYYTPAESLFTELIMAISSGNTMDFKRKYRSQDLLLIDDVHYLVGKERLQEEVFHIFNHMHSSGKQVVFTSDRPVKEISTLEERLSSRLVSGLVADLQAPDLETRIAILKRKAEAEDFDLPQDVALYIANRVKTNIRQLEGCLVRIIALSSISGKTVTVETAAKALKDLVPGSPAVSRDLILQRIAEVTGVTPAEIKGRTRTKRITLARQLAMYLFRQCLELSLKEIGALLGGKDHTTVMHSLAKIEEMRRTDPEFDEKIKELIMGITG